MSDVVSMNYATPDAPRRAGRRPRLWLGVAIVIAMWLVIKLPEWLTPGTMYQFMGMMWGPMLGLLGVLIWWLLLSRLPWATRLTGFLAFVVGVAIAIGLGDVKSMMMPYIIFTLPLSLTLWVLWTAIGRRLGPKPFRIGLVLGLVGLWSIFALFRFNGLNGNVHAALAWRWQQTAEEKFLQSLPANLHGTSPTTVAATTQPALVLSPGDWPEFRGPMRDSRITGITIAIDWEKNPPKKLWSHLIGPGWSSLCVVGDRLFTQEQRGPVEVVACYSTDTGSELWTHGDKDRFEEAIAGPGPRATPTFKDGRLYAYGSKSRLNCLDPLTGSVIWSRDVASETGAKLPMWGFASSPLVANGLVYVITGAPNKSMAAYHADTGEPAWSSCSGYSYSSPQISKIDGADQLLLVNEAGVSAMDPITGTLIWKHDFQMPPQANRVTQPLVFNGNELLLGAFFGVGTRRIKITHDANAWKTQEIWTSRSIKPYYNDAVIHKGNLYGFDGSAFCCINLETGKPFWRAPGAYGNGQLLLLADQDLLLVLSEQGDAALVDAKTNALHEVARFHALEGKTWNHPVLAHQKLFVRNGEEIACYAMP
jgi:outer membrane protein assembly factor BamB